MFSYIAAVVIVMCSAAASGIVVGQQATLHFDSPFLGFLALLTVTIGSGYLYKAIVDAFWPYGRWAKVILDEITLGKCDETRETLYKLGSYDHLGFRFTTNDEGFDIIEVGRISLSGQCLEYIEATLSVLDAVRIKQKLDVSTGAKPTFYKTLSEYKKQPPQEPKP